ncbi:hypothetical protein F4780DRAFT_41625 [Xylariomycetidae sp. FL0641]|nr:hypothetical protein F4780DRAFT_41625 [Xylariomycetidae sp. FL0641]
MDVSKVGTGILFCHCAATPETLACSPSSSKFLPAPLLEAPISPVQPSTRLPILLWQHQHHHQPCQLQHQLTPISRPLDAMAEEENNGAPHSIPLDITGRNDLVASVVTSFGPSMQGYHLSADANSLPRLDFDISMKGILYDVIFSSRALPSTLIAVLSVGGEELTLIEGSLPIVMRCATVLDLSAPATLVAVFPRHHLGNTGGTSESAPAQDDEHAEDKTRKGGVFSRIRRVLGFARRHG